MRARTFWAFLIAPLIGTIAAWIGFIATAVVVGRSLSGFDEMWQNALHWLPIFVVFGAPLAVAAALLAVPIYMLLRSDNRVSTQHIIAWAIVLAAGLTFGFWTLSFGWGFALVLLPSGVLAGVASGVAFARVWRGDSTHAV